MMEFEADDVQSTNMTHTLLWDPRVGICLKIMKIVMFFFLH